MKIKLFLLLALISFLGLASHAEAVTIVDSGWFEFMWESPAPSPWIDIISGDPISFSFSLINPAILTVTDVYDSGDRLTVKDFGSALGNTSDPTSGSWTNSKDYAATHSEWSSGKFYLSPGAHNISGTAIQIAPDNDTGIGGLRVDTVIPEPASLSLLGLGLLGLLGIGRKKIRKA